MPVTLSRSSDALRIILPLAKQQYSVTVESRPLQLDTDTNAHQDAFTLDRSSFTSLPNKGGDILSALNSFVNPAGGAAPTVVVDGVERDDADFPPGSLEQLRINNNAYSAEFPKPGKDRIEVETRGSTEEFHGAIGTRARNSVFDARNPLAPKSPPFSRYGYEGNVSGPILRRRIIFFLDASSELQQRVQPVVAYLPTGLFQSAIFSPFEKDRFLGRLHWQVNPPHRLGLKYELHLDKTENNGVGGFALPQLATSLYHHDCRIEISDQYVLSPDALNNFRIALGTNHLVLTSANDQPQTIVQGGFLSGGAQVNEWRDEPHTDILSYSKGPNDWKFGAEASWRATSKPIPLFAPVTRAIFPDVLYFCFSPGLIVKFAR